MWIACSWRPDESGELVRLFAEIDRVQLLVPVDVGSSQSGGPLELEIPGESSFDFKRLLGFDFEQDHRAHLIPRNAQRFADAEGIAGIQNRCRLGLHRQRSRETFSGKCAVADMKDQVEPAKNLQRIDPRFKSSRFIAE